ncbi:2-keto-4-pentenoate hydratase [Undibacterium parvum]|uniref:4-oxalocrotonate decarboxylase n=1 Tax=Undibacterium parvum TaxID=401471 RepID=A0A3S9HGZ7_9BURK|nr:4-oxalocrotonate decarboxylase [Undibacterium parvum]AZP11363.1 4-oxalocrotonate decarboxylase [Undibacterium parvum]
MNARDYALEILQARASGQTLPAVSSRTELKLEQAYEIAKNIDEIRKGLGERPIGRSLSVSWNTPHGEDALARLSWTTLFDATVRHLPSNVCLQSLEGAMRPKISAVVIFKLATTPAAEASLEQLVSSIEWMAHGIEILVTPYPDEAFSDADAIAALGLHGTLLIGPAQPLSLASRAQLGQLLANASVSLSCDGSLIAAGYGSKVLDSPVHALRYIHQQLKLQSQFPPLQAGEIISTGSWTAPITVQTGQTWSSAFSGLDLAGISVSFV